MPRIQTQQLLLKKQNWWITDKIVHTWCWILKILDILIMIDHLTFYFSWIKKKSHRIVCDDVWNKCWSQSFSFGHILQIYFEGNVVWLPFSFSLITCLRSFKANSRWLVSDKLKYRCRTSCSMKKNEENKNPNMV